MGNRRVVLAFARYCFLCAKRNAVRVVCEAERASKPHAQHELTRGRWNGRAQLTILSGGEGSELRQERQNNPTRGFLFWIVPAGTKKKPCMQKRKMSQENQSEQVRLRAWCAWQGQSRALALFRAGKIRQTVHAPTTHTHTHAHAHLQEPAKKLAVDTPALAADADVDDEYADLPEQERNNIKLLQVGVLVAHPHCTHVRTLLKPLPLTPHNHNAPSPLCRQQ